MSSKVSGSRAGSWSVGYEGLDGDCCGNWGSENIWESWREKGLSVLAFLAEERVRRDGELPTSFRKRLAALVREPRGVARLLPGTLSGVFGEADLELKIFRGLLRKGVRLLGAVSSSLGSAGGRFSWSRLLIVLVFDAAARLSRLALCEGVSAESSRDFTCPAFLGDGNSTLRVLSGVVFMSSSMGLAFDPGNFGGLESIAFWRAAVAAASAKKGPALLPRFCDFALVDRCVRPVVLGSDLSERPDGCDSESASAP